MKSIRKAITSLALALAVTALAFNVEAQTTNNAALTHIVIPFTTLQSTSAVLVTNLSAGWETYAYNTNISTFWSNSISELVTVTNTSITTNTKYADFSAQGQTIVPIQHEFNTSAGTSNVMLYVSRSVNGVYFPTNSGDESVTIITNAGRGVTYTVAPRTVDMTGYEYGRIIFIKWDTVNASDVLTNRALIKGNKRQLFRP